jgi:hypothetical protein
MPKFSNLFLTQEGKPIQVGGQTITVISRSLRWLPPVGFGGIVWNRPVAVRVRSGTVEHLLPIVDVTRRRQVAILALGIVGIVVLAMLTGRPK